MLHFFWDTLYELNVWLKYHAPAIHPFSLFPIIFPEFRVRSESRERTPLKEKLIRSTFLSVFHFQKLLTTEMDRSRKMRQQVISLPSMLLLMSWLGGLVHHIAWIIVRSHCIVWISAFWHFCHWHSYKSPASNLPLNVHCHSYYGIVPSTALHCHAIGYCQLP